MKKFINILLWALQILLAFYFVSGGIYMMHNYKILTNPWVLNILPNIFWTILGALQILFAIGLVIPGLGKILPKQISISAIGLITISLLGIVLYGAYVGAGVLWAVIPSILLALVACWRWFTR